jgi:ATP-binding cassette subfamily C (CFTR/MRP) protein 1
MVILYRIIFQNLLLVIGPVSTFAVFTLMANASGKTLQTANAFSVLSVISLIESPLQSLVYSIPTITSSAACFGRIQQFLLSPTRHDHRISIWTAGSRSTNKDACSRHDLSSGIELTHLSSASNAVTEDAVVVEDGSFGWIESGHPVLHNINIRIKSSSLVMVIGPVGCGKSTLVKGLIGETPAAQVVYQVLLDRVPRSSNGLHLSLFTTVIRAPLSFFTRIDSWTNLNRFIQVSLIPSVPKVVIPHPLCLN